MDKEYGGPIELYCTYFDHNYLRKGLALYLSLRKQSQGQNSILAVLALSEECESALMQLSLPGLLILPLKNLETKYPDLLEAKSNRKLVEYYFTLTPWLIKETLRIVPNAYRVTYLDSDLYFFGSPKPLWSEIGESPIAMVEHRFSPSYVDKIIYGRFNVGWNSFNRSSESIKALNWWAEACVLWCYDRVENGKFADQKYLEEIYKNSPNVHIISYPGINLAEYNLDNYRLSIHESKPYANGLPVVYWHMHCLFEKSDGSYHVGIREDLATNPVIRWAYESYINELSKLEKKLIELNVRVFKGNSRYPQVC